MSLGSRPAGTNTVTWDARDAEGTVVVAGVYWLRVESPGGTSARQKVVVTR